VKVEQVDDESKLEEKTSLLKLKREDNTLRNLDGISNERR